MSFLIASGHINVEARTDKAKSAITGVVGALGALGPAGVAAGASMAAAGAGIAAFGVAAGKQVASIAKVSQAQTKYREAVGESGRASQAAAKAQLDYQRTLAVMPRATQEAAVAFGSLKESYTEWSDSLASNTMPVFTKSFAIFQALLPKTTGLVQGTSRELDRLVTVIAGGVASPGFDRFMDKLEDFSSAALRKMTDGLISLSQSLSSFGGSSQFDRFVANAREAGPVISETLASVGKALLHLTEAGHDVGLSLLTVVDVFADLVNAIPPEVLGTLLQLYAAFKLVKLGAVGVIALSGGMAGFAASLTAMRAASLAAGGGLAGLAAAFGTLSKAAKATVVVAGVAAVVMAIQKLSNLGREAPPNVERLTTALGELGRSGKVGGEAARLFGDDLDGLYESVRNITDPSVADNIQNGLVKVFSLGFMDSTPSKEAKESLDAIDDALADMVQGGRADLAAAALKRLAAEYSKGGKNAEDFKRQMDGYKEKLKQQEQAMQLTADGMGIFGQQALETSRKLDAQKASADGLRQAIINLNDVNRTAHDAHTSFEAGIDALTESFAKHGKTLDDDTDAGRANRTAMSQVSKAHDELLVSGIAAGGSMESMIGKSESLRLKMTELATATFGNSKEAREYVNSLLGTPESIRTMVKLEHEGAVRGLGDVQAAIKKTPGAKSIKVEALNSSAIASLEAVGLKTKQLKDGRTQVFTQNGQALGSIGAVREALAALKNRTVTVTTHYRSDGANFQGASGRYAAGGPVRRYASGGGVQAFPFGGLAIGPGTGTSDSIPALVSNGEWVMKAAAVARYGTRFMAAINDGRLPKFAKGGLTQAQKDARKSLTSDVTFTTAGKLAGFKNAEMSRDLGTPDSVSALAGTINTYLSQIKAAFTGKTESSLVGKMTSSGKALLAHQKKLEGVNKSLDAAKSNFDDLKGKFDSLKTSISSSLMSFGNITKLGKYGTSPETLIKQLTSDAGRTSQFAGQLEQLKARGLNGQMIEDIASAGVTGGGMATAQTILAANPDQIARINELQKQLTTSANKAGTVAADAMYGAGLRAAEGLVKGLTAQQSAIEAAMMKIAKSMEAAIKKALGIKSPSRVMMQLGQHTADGFNIGVASRKSLITAPNKMSIQAPSSAAAQTGPTINLTVNVNSNDLASSPAERRRIANLLVKETNDALRIYQRERRR